MRSNSGAERRNFSTSPWVAKPITLSTPVRMYQLRSTRTISPAPRSCMDIALKEPLGPLAFVRSRKGNHAADSRIEALRDALDNTPVPKPNFYLEDDHHLAPALMDPVLQVHHSRWSSRARQCWFVGPSSTVSAARAPRGRLVRRHRPSAATSDLAWRVLHIRDGRKAPALFGSKYAHPRMLVGPHTQSPWDRPPVVRSRFTTAATAPVTARSP